MEVDLLAKNTTAILEIVKGTETLDIGATAESADALADPKRALLLGLPIPLHIDHRAYPNVKLIVFVTLVR